jgi:hypothetical protein
MKLAENLDTNAYPFDPALRRCEFGRVLAFPVRETGDSLIRDLRGIAEEALSTVPVEIWLKRDDAELFEPNRNF